MNRIRRIVSGKKARFVTEDGDELDLCYITDRIIICGLPSSGVEALYRNDRSTLRHFLQSRYGTQYRIFNFCPRFENGYDAAYFNHQVSRFPFPDHHPPPLSMIPLVTRAMQQWMEADDENIIVIHCKAGKGRSGTMCCCYLLSLPTLPKPPQLAQNYSKGSKRPERLLAANAESSLPSPIGQDSESDSADEAGNGRSDRASRAQSGGAALDLAGKRGTDRHNKGRERITQLVENLASSGDEVGIGHPDDREDESSEASDDEQDQAADKEMRGMADKLQQIFDLHTAQRMKPQKSASTSSAAGQTLADSPVTASPTSSKAPFKYPKKPVRGVSIPSQRRFVSYWSRVLTKADPRPLDLLAPPNPSRLERVRREVCITEVRIYMPSRMPGFPALISGKRVSVHLGRYKTSFVDGLEKRELALREERRLEKMLRRQPDRVTREEQEKLRSLQRSYAEWKDDEDWDDRSKMFEGEGCLVERSETSSAGDLLDGDADSDAQEDQPFRRLLPKPAVAAQRSLQVDADREVQLKILIGDTGKKHAFLPDVGSLGYAWVIPSFEASIPPAAEDPASLRFTSTLDFAEIDFFKPQSGILKMEVDFLWTIS